MKRQPSIQDVTWFLDLNRSDKLNLDPPYQRKSVWTLKDKRYFMDTIFRDYPCPPIFLHKDLDENGSATYHVVDGKQRLQAIIGFTENQFSLDKEFGDNNLSGKTWKDVPSEYKKKLWDYVLSVEYINDISDTATVNEVFDRVNRNQKKLEPQELRHAKYSGWFVIEAEAEAEDEIWKKYGISTTARARRMRDVQFISELMLVVVEGNIKGFDQESIDEKYAAYDDPSQGTFDFNEQDYKDKMFKVKQYLNNVEQHGAVVSRNAKNLTHFYTLWSLVTLNIENLPKPSIFAKSYDDFMELVRAASKDKETKYEMHISEYLASSTGASTDLKPRTQRLDSLQKATLSL